MPRTTIAAQDASAGLFVYSSTGLTLTATAADASNLNRTAACTRLLLIARNTGASGRVVTITSSADARTGRTGNASLTLAAGATVMFIITKEGWQQDDAGTKYFYYEAAHAEVVFSPVILEP